MKLKIGVENIMPQSSEKFSQEEYNAMMEELSVLDHEYFADELMERQQYTAYALISGANSLPEEQKKVVYDFLSQDESMKAVIEASEEGQKLQDYFRWGLFGLVVGLYLGSFGRIRKCLSNGILDPSKNSQYLLPEQYVDQCLKASEDMLTAIKSGKAKNVLDTFRKNGFKIDSATDTDWEAVLGTIAGRFVGSFIIGPIGGAVGTILGKYASEKVRKTAGEHGYTDANFKKHCQRIIKIINELESLKGAEQTLDDPGAKAVVKKALKMICQGVSTIGRGFCAVTR